MSFQIVSRDGQELTNSGIVFQSAIKIKQESVLENPQKEYENGQQTDKNKMNESGQVLYKVRGLEAFYVDEDGDAERSAGSVNIKITDVSKQQTIKPGVAYMPAGFFKQTSYVSNGRLAFSLEASHFIPVDSGSHGQNKVGENK